MYFDFEVKMANNVGMQFYPNASKRRDKIIGSNFPFIASSHCRNTAKTDEKIAGPYSECFWHLQSTLNLAWYPKSRSHDTHKCCQQRCTALTAF